MGNKDSKILVVQEYGPFVSISASATHLGLTGPVFWKLLWQSLKALSSESTTDTFIETSGHDRYRFTGIAGIIVLRPGTRIEIVPKFLDPGTVNWREDFLTIALLTRHGHLLQNIPVSSRPSKNVDLYELVADAWVNLFEANSRSLIRTYVRAQWADFHLDGDADAEDLIVPSDRGFLQRGIKLSRSNSANKLLKASAVLLANRISNPRNTARLNRSISLLSTAAHEVTFNRKAHSNRRPTVWLPLLELAQTVVSNNSLGFSDFGHAFLPGYIIKTHYAWEKLMLMLSKRAFPHMAVSKSRLKFGRRIFNNGMTKKVEIEPDIILRDKATTLLVDAKYKTMIDPSSRQSTSISVADIYEAHAYLKITDTKRMLLFYPGVIRPEDHESAEPFEVFESGDLRVEAHLIDVSGVSSRGGLKKLADRVKDKVKPYLPA